MKRTAMLFGLSTGAAIVILVFSVYFAYGRYDTMSLEDLSSAELAGFFRYLIMITGVILAIWFFKRRTGASSFRQLFLSGLYTGAVIAIIIGVMEMSYLLIYPEFYQHYGDLSLLQMKAGGASAKELENFRLQMAESKWLANPGAAGIFYFLETLILCAVFALLGALILRSKQVEPEPAD